MLDQTESDTGAEVYGYAIVPCLTPDIYEHTILVMHDCVGLADIKYIRWKAFPSLQVQGHRIKPTTIQGQEEQTTQPAVKMRFQVTFALLQALATTQVLALAVPAKS